MSEDARPTKRKADEIVGSDLAAEAQKKKDKKAKKKAKKAKKKAEAAAAAAAASAAAAKAEKKRLKKEKKAAKKAKKDKKSKKPEKQEITSTSTSSSAPASSSRNSNGFIESVAMQQLTEAQVKAHRDEHEILLHPPNDAWNLFKPMLQFDDLRPTLGAFAQPFLDYFKSKKFVKPSPIQSQCWSPLLQGRDVIGIAATGSGKTLSFLLPAVLKILRLKEEDPTMKSVKNGPFALVIAPTRELAMQSDVVAKEISEFMDITSMCVYGGVPMGQMIRKIKSSHIDIVVATCGRLVHMARDNLLSLAQIRFLILDEADRMLDDGFAPDIKEIVGQCAPNRQTIMFSATWPDEVKKLASQLMKDHVVHINVGSLDLSANSRVTQTVEVFPGPSGGSRRTARLYEVLEKYHGSAGCKNRVLLFVLYKKEAAWLANMLKRPGRGPGQPKYNVEAIHGDVPQSQRTQALEDFRSGKVPLLIATDVAARGLDIPNVEVVINYSFPLTVEDYCHRIGRTGRAGKTGISHTFFTDENKSLAGQLVNVLNEANQPVPEKIKIYPLFTKKKLHNLYGAFGPDESLIGTKSTKLTFDD